MVISGKDTEVPHALEIQKAQPNPKIRKLNKKDKTRNELLEL